MKFLRHFTLMMSILLIGAGNIRAEPGPFENFFRKMRRAFNEPQKQHKPETHRTPHKQNAVEPATSPSEPANTPKASAGVSAPPSERNTRSTSRVVAKKGEDLRYGTPVPGKQGFVTSPFAPNSGYIDVRGFAPGTPVKDPYTGKVFLTP